MTRIQFEDPIFNVEKQNADFIEQEEHAEKHELLPGVFLNYLVSKVFFQMILILIKAQ